MRMTLGSYWPLLLLVVIPYLWWARRDTVVGLTPKHMELATIVRASVVCLLALALMHPVLHIATDAVSVVYLLDISRSVAPESIQESLNWIRNTAEAGNAAHTQFIAFGSNSMQFGSLDDLTNVPVASRQQDGAIDQSATDLAGALGHAMRTLAPHHLQRVVVLSDGNENARDIAPMLARLNREKVKVYTVGLNARGDGDVSIESILAPSTVTADEQFPVEVHVYSQAPTTSRIDIRNGDKLLESRSVSLVEGLNRIAFETNVPEETTTAILTATVTPDSDSFSANNTFRQPVTVNGRPRILYVESHAPSVQYLRNALTVEGLLVDVADPGKFPSTVAELDRYDAVILSDIDPQSLSAQQMQSLEIYVRELGGGFILAGGENSYGKDGYQNSPIEKALPVTFETVKRPPTVAMVAAIDVSGSMSAGQLALAKEAAKAPLGALRNSDQFGVLSFNTASTWIAPIQPASNRDTLTEQIERLFAGGGTNIYVGLNAAFAALRNNPAEVKTVVLLSDGITQTADHRSLTTSMMNAGINVSSISVGQQANRELMADIAMWGKGRAYYIDSYERVPQIFMKETELALGRTLLEQPFVPLVAKQVEAFKGIDFDAAPRLLGYVATKAKPSAEVLLTESWTGAPLLARWQYGLGKTAAFTSDVKSRWAAEWIGWNGYPKFWAQLVRETMRRRADDTFDMTVVRDGDSAVISINALETDGRFRNDLQPEVRVIGPNQTVSLVQVPQVGPGAYETRTRLEPTGSYVFRATAGEAGAASRNLEYSYPAEYHFSPTDVDQLRSMSTATGGKFAPDGPEIFEANGESVEFPVHLWPWIAAAALALYLVDILLRRVRIFEDSETTP